ncbi:hypothetical protein NNC19_17980 [Clostridium sp. SHJSY1]|uniref:competence protein CoiA family protein n=1 Tax=Clostridium sp. SHJSY1 TaxID=2942483 RepID=UPI002876707E|nr:hypothetical protein [Clostridium sp. SHJSY1]MDS0527584.1 hypothetical protein [Clostridium sp. SHJSY1]
MKIKLPFGFREDRLIHISEINENERGLRCNCVCPECRQPLEARLGNKNIRHFAHSNQNCKNAFETTLHKFAKEILEKSRKIKLPELKLIYNKYYKSMSDFELSYYKFDYKNFLDNEGYKEKTIANEFFLEFDEIKLETQINTIVPDIIVYKNGVPLLIEIAVTHYIDNEKERKIKELGISTIEIDLNIKEIDCYNFDRKVIEHIIVDNIDRKKWIYNRKSELAKRKILYNNKIKAEKERIREKQKLSEYNRKIDLKLKKVEFLISNYEKKIKEFEIDFELNKLWNEISNRLNIKAEDIPEYFNYVVPGELAFNCDRRIWQSYVFEKFILNRKGNVVMVCNVIKWIKKYSALPINKDLEYTKDIKGKNIPDLTSAILKYLLYLRDYGFLHKERCSENFYTSFLVVNDELFMTAISKEEKIQGFMNEMYINTVDRIDKGVNTKTEDEKDIVINRSIYVKTWICRLCRQKTSDWTIYYGEDKTCICRACNEIREY